MSVRDGIISDGEEDNVIVAAAQPRRRVGRPKTRYAAIGSFVLVFLIVDAAGFWKNYVGSHATPENLDGHCIGVGLTRWELLHEATAATRWLADAEKLRVRANRLLGYVVWPSHEYASLVNPFRVPDNMNARDLAANIATQLASPFNIEI